MITISSLYFIDAPLTDVGFADTCNGAIDLLRIAYQRKQETAEMVAALSMMQLSVHAEINYQIAKMDHQSALTDVALLQHLAFPS